MQSDDLAADGEDFAVAGELPPVHLRVALPWAADDGVDHQRRAFPFGDALTGCIADGMDGLLSVGGEMHRGWMAGGLRFDGNAADFRVFVLHFYALPWSVKGTPNFAAGSSRLQIPEKSGSAAEDKDAAQNANITARRILFIEGLRRLYMLITLTRRNILFGGVALALHQNKIDDALRLVEAKASTGEVAAAAIEVQHGDTVIRKAFGKGQDTGRGVSACVDHKAHDLYGSDDIVRSQGIIDRRSRSRNICRNSRGAAGIACWCATC